MASAKSTIIVGKDLFKIDTSAHINNPDSVPDLSKASLTDKSPAAEKAQSMNNKPIAGLDTNVPANTVKNISSNGDYRVLNCIIIS